MKIGIIGYQGSGKSTLFEWLTGVKSDPALAHTAQSAMATVPDVRVEPLCKVYSPKKITLASLELVDTPGLSRSHEGNAARLGLIREAGCLVLVVAAYSGGDPLADVQAFDEDFLLADMQIVSGRIDRIKETMRKPLPKAEREQQEIELAALEPLLAQLEAGKNLAAAEMTDEQLKATSSFRLLTQKPKLVIVNLADDGSPEHFAGKAPPGVTLVAIPLGLEVELGRMSPEDRAEFEREMGVGHSDRDSLLRTIMDVSGQMLYFTAGDKEVRTWMLRQGGTALEAADNIHSDLARGFIRAEVIQCDDLIRLGSEREIKAHNLLRQEPKDYVIRDGDILHIRFSV
jgi:ribosome-binding ATPase YchF (GTP1/OBG family)